MSRTALRSALILGGLLALGSAQLISADIVNSYAGTLASSEDVATYHRRG